VLFSHYCLNYPMKMTNLTLDEKRRLMTADRLLSLNALNHEQLLGLARGLASVVMVYAPDEVIESDWKTLYEPIWRKGIKDIHKD
jgi:hypothetical protein